MYFSALTDNELVARYQKDGDNHAMACLYKRYAPLVFGLCYKHLQHEETTKDAVSDIFLIVLHKARDHTIFSFRHWLYSISRNYLYTRHRYPGTRVAEPVEKFPEKIMEKPPPATLIVQERNLTYLDHALNGLDRAQRTCVELFYMRTRSYKEIAAATGYDVKKVKSCIQNGKRNLRLYFERNHISYDDE